MGDYRKLLVWTRAHRLTLNIYHATASFPDAERYGITSQCRRSAASIGSNLAEGCGRNSDRELARSCRIALGSANELEYQLELAWELGMLDPITWQSLASEVREVKHMLANLATKLMATPAG